MLTNNLFKWFCVLLGSLLLTNEAVAQNKIQTKFICNSCDIKKLEDSVSIKYGYRLYYDVNEFEGFTFSVNMDNASIEQLINQIFSTTSFKYSLDTFSRIFLSKKEFIKTSLPPNLFIEKSNWIDTASDLIRFDLNSTRNKGLLKIADENKLIEIGKNIGNDKGKAIITGYVKDLNNGEAIAGATIYIDSPFINARSDQYGYYTISLPKGRHTLKVSSMGKKEIKLQLGLHEDGKLNIELTDFVENLKEVVVYNKEKSANVRSMQMGNVKLNIKSIKSVPMVFGEADIMKVILTLPGVTSVGEASAGFNVRGGSTDQNLILLNDATIYNPAHLFGFFSAFNSDIVKNIELYKSAIPEKYSGRLSSVLAVEMKEGNTKKWTGVAGISPLTSKLTLEGPLNNGNTNIILGGRTTYSNWILHSLPNEAYNKSDARFYDLNLNIKHTINTKNSLYLTGYMSNDYFNFNNDTTYQYGNKSWNLKWRHVFNNKLNGVMMVGSDHYQYNIASEYVPINGYQLGFDINQFNFRADYSYKLNYDHDLNFGVTSIKYLIHPGSYKPNGNSSLVMPNILNSEKALESAVYFGDSYSINANLSINAGVHYTFFNYLGDHNVYSYLPNMPVSLMNIMDTLGYNNGQVINTYSAPEYRVSLRYVLPKNSSIKLSYNTTRQYIHMLSNTTAISPTDIWKLSDPNIKPQKGTQFAIGYYKNLLGNTIETSVEVYYKIIENYIDYKSGASLLLNKHIETDVLNSKGKAYGIEFLVKKTAGQLNGWLSYTYSRTFLKTDNSINQGESINNGSYYPASFDKPHNLNVIANYQFSHRVSISANMVYSSGRPITLPLAQFNVGGASSLFYSQRNQYRIPDYFRADIAVNLEGNHKVKQKLHNSWSFGIYNLTGRQNAYSVYFINTNGRVQGNQLSLFGTIIPFVSYNIKF
jgi:hypothetical protein